MSFELETENIRMFEPIKTANVKTVIDTDIIVPDTKPDVLNILQVNALSSITEKHIQKDSMSVMGYVDYTVLYSGGEENIQVKSISYRAPFSQHIDAAGISENMFSYVTSNVSHIEFHIQNSRKINVKSVVAFDTGAYSLISVNAASNVLTEHMLPLKEDDIKALNICVCSNSKIAVSDEIRLSSSAEGEYELLKTEVKLSDTEVKTMNNKVVIKGNLITDTLYLLDDDIHHIENEIPFTEVLDVDDISPQMHTEIKYNITGCTTELADDSEEKIMKLDASVDVLIKAFEENIYSVITDIYSPDFQMELDSRPCKFFSVDDVMSRTFSLNETVTISENMPGIVKVYNLTVNPVAESKTVNNGIGKIDGYMQTKLLYLSDSKAMPVYSYDKKIPFSFEVKADLEHDDVKMEADISLEHASYALKSERDAEIRVTVKADTKFVSSSAKEIITDITLNEDAPLQKTGQPGITIYFADDNENLWDIAKRYNTTTEEIAAINNISENEILQNRQQLLIPKRVTL